MNLHIAISMNPSVSNFPSDILEVIQHLLFAPTQHPGERSHREGLKPIFQPRLVPFPKILTPVVHRPRVDGENQSLALDINESCLFHDLFCADLISIWFSSESGGVLEVSLPVEDGGVGAESSIVGAEVRIDLDVFYPAETGLEVSIASVCQNTVSTGGD